MAQNLRIHRSASRRFVDDEVRFLADIRFTTLKTYIGSLSLLGSARAALLGSTVLFLLPQLGGALSRSF